MQLVTLILIKEPDGWYVRKIIKCKAKPWEDPREKVMNLIISQDRSNTNEDHIMDEFYGADWIKSQILSN